MNGLEDRDVITGYHPTVDYDRAGLGHHLLVVATVPLEDQEAIVDDIVDVSGVVCVRELLTGTHNLSVELVGYNRQGMEQSLTRLNELGVDVERTEMVRRERRQPYNHFGEQFAGEDGTG